jgi:hypothetical protein
MTDYVDVLTAGGWVTVDVTASEENGMLDSEVETAGDAVEAVRRNMVAGNFVLDSSGRHTLIVGSALVYSYYRKR